MGSLNSNPFLSDSSPIIQETPPSLNKKVPSKPSLEQKALKSHQSLEDFLCPLLVPSPSSLVPSFSPWRPGDAYSVENFGGNQIRQWDERGMEWRYQSAASISDLPQNGYTGALFVVVLIIILWLYSFHRLYRVWVHTLNF